MQMKRMPVTFTLGITSLAHYLHCGLLLPQFFSEDLLQCLETGLVVKAIRSGRGSRHQWLQKEAADLQCLGWFPIAKNHVAQIPKAPRLITHATQSYKSVTRTPKLLI